eukprot:2092300-Amphidinium_carterae.4
MMHVTSCVLVFFGLALTRTRDCQCFEEWICAEFQGMMLLSGASKTWKARNQSACDCIRHVCEQSVEQKWFYTRCAHCCQEVASALAYTTTHSLAAAAQSRRSSLANSGRGPFVSYLALGNSCLKVGLGRWRQLAAGTWAC